MNKRNFKKGGIALTVLIIIAIGIVTISRANSLHSYELPNNLVGTWVGETTPIVNWVNAKSIPITIPR